MKILQIMTFPKNELEMYNLETMGNFHNPQYMGFDYLKSKTDIEWCYPCLENKFTQFLDKLAGAHVTSFVLGQFLLIGKIRKYDIIFSPLDSHIFLLALFRKLRLCKAPIVMICHSTYRMDSIPSFKKRIFKWFEKQIVFHSVDKIVFLNDRIKMLSVGEMEYEVANWGASSSFYKIDSSIKCSKRNYYLAVGQAKRDYSTLIDAFSEMPSVQLKILARGEDVLRGIKRESIPSNISFISNPNDTDHWLRMRDIYAGAKASLIPLKISSDVPSGATVIVESVAAGVPIIISSMLSNYLDVDDNRIGVSVKTNTKEEWIECINRMELDGDILDSFSKNAINIAETRYNYHDYCEKILTILNSINYGK